MRCPIHIKPAFVTVMALLFAFGITTECSAQNESSIQSLQQEVSELKNRLKNLEALVASQQDQIKQLKNEKSAPANTGSSFPAVAVQPAPVNALREAIVGKWVKQGAKPESVQFWHDGAFSMKAGADAFDGAYHFTGPAQIRIDLGGIAALAGPQVYSVSVVGSQLVLASEKNNVKAIYSKVLSNSTQQEK